MPLILSTPSDLSMGLAARAKAVRLTRNMTQVELAQRAGVSVSSLKRFEAKGLASLDLVARIALILDGAEALEAVFAVSAPKSIDDLVEKQPRRRARKPR